MAHATPTSPTGEDLAESRETPRQMVMFAWKVPFFNEDGSFSHFIVPHSDPYEYERPIDYLFDTPEEARAFLRAHDPIDEGSLLNEARSEGWVLVQVTHTALATATEVLDTQPDA